MNCMQKQKTSINKRIIGSHYEKKAADFLKEKGYFILCTNYRCRFGEIDIIAQYEKYIVFVEVKFKSNSFYGYPREAVNYKKQQKIKLTAKFYLRQYEKYEVGCRFDVVEILGNEIIQIEAAF